MERGLADNRFLDSLFVSDGVTSCVQENLFFDRGTLRERRYSQEHRRCPLFLEWNGNGPMQLKGWCSQSQTVHRQQLYRLPVPVLPANRSQVAYVPSNAHSTSSQHRRPFPYVERPRRSRLQGLGAMGARGLLELILFGRRQTCFRRQEPPASTVRCSLVPSNLGPVREVPSVGLNSFLCVRDNQT